MATIADVWLNDHPILASDNMFLAHEVLIDEVLATANELIICFRSLDVALSTKRPRPRWRAPMVENQQLRWYRTTLLGRTPGWSPPAQVVGPWREIWIASCSSPDLQSVDLRPTLDGETGWINAQLEISGMDPDAHCVLVVSRNELVQRSDMQREAPDRFSARARIPQPDLWWPHTHGMPALYSVILEIYGHNGTLRTTFDLGNIAFRRITINSTRDHFLIEVNGTTIFCRGACWTPLDPVTLHANQDQYDFALGQVRSAGMNMLRVGGTMVYESDHFYAACDALGIMIWQDFMFANMDYPQDDAHFLESATCEVAQALSRLRNHPCLTVLCGNSEVEQQAAMWGADRALWAPALFHEIIAANAQAICPDVPYWPSSAHGGSFPHLGDVGTTSYYGVGAYLRPMDDARRSQVKFATECLALANVPEVETLAAMPGGLSIKVHHPGWKSRTPRDLGAGWDFDDVRDHYLGVLFDIDPLKLRYANHERYLELSRVTSAEIMSATFGEWRRRDSVCGGALVWFLRDLWPGAGWGIIASDSVPKAAYYYLRRALQPVAMWISDEGGNGLGLHVANELPNSWDAQIELALYRHSEHLVARHVRSVSFESHQSLELQAADWFETFRDLSNAFRFGPPSQDLIIATLRSTSIPRPIQSVHFPLGHSAQVIADAGLIAQARPNQDGTFQLEINTRAFAYAVNIEAAGFHCEDGYFHLAPGSQRVLTLLPMPGGKNKVPRGRVTALNAQEPAAIRLIE